MKERKSHTKNKNNTRKEKQKCKIANTDQENI